MKRNIITRFLASFILALLCWTTVPSTKAQAATLTPAGRLKRLSRMITGVDPAPADYAGLTTAIQKNQVETFFQAKAAQYISTPQHLNKMIFRLQELFRFKTRINSDDGQINYDLSVPGTNGSFTTIQKSLTLDLESSAEILFKDIIQNNENWDDLLLSKSYTVKPPFVLPPGAYVDPTLLITMPDSQFFQGIFSDLDNLDEAKTVSGDANDPRLAGVLTTARFATRYATSVVNKNRRRAAAVFRIFLCDDMKPSVQITQGDMDKLIELALKANAADAVEEATATAHRQLTDAQLHGSNPQCAACHYKLDPMGEAFAGMGAFLADQPTPGELRYHHADGSPVEVAGRGLGDVAKAVTQEPEYAQCQVRHFWSWFMPAKTTLTDSRLQELASAFDQMGRKPNTFISYLVNQPEFYGGTGPATAATSTASNITVPSTSTATAATAPVQPTGLFMTRIKPVLSKCSQCHMTMGFPDFTHLPIGGNMALNQAWISKIVEKLDLAHNGAGRTMPPNAAGWDLSPADLAGIKQWIAQDAPDASGTKTLPAQEGQTLLGGSTK